MPTYLIIFLFLSFFDIPLRLLRLLRNLSDGSPNFTASAASAVNFLASMEEGKLQCLLSRRVVGGSKESGSAGTLLLQSAAGLNQIRFNVAKSELRNLFDGLATTGTVFQRPTELVQCYLSVTGDS